ncbi:MAG: phosphoribosylaminoimidazolesuccinocarboxamide synthase [Candidatus Margulisbacteria bacterium GWF2_35_9]|nr:MAG: phosphoribosylaminoimidazolesuccinocarboxamide synthase [Candidatus Margulisbacteria bacterium GWF2_35_9]
MEEGVMKTINLEGIKKIKTGKVRELFDVGDNLLLVATDRISAFDYVLPQTIPDKGAVLNSISAFWFNLLKDVIPNHMISINVNDYPEELKQYKDILEKRSMLVKKTDVVKLECIVRGYISGSGWKEYQKSGTVCGISLPKGLKREQKLPEPIFTPSTKADDGEHDENINASTAESIVGKEVFDIVRSKSLELYKKASEYAFKKGIIIADTKFEFGMLDGKIILIDEALTPDSSRFWPADVYEVGQVQNSFDKQFVRNYLLDLEWDMEPPVPDLPEMIVSRTSDKYKEAYFMLTGKSI